MATVTYAKATRIYPGNPTPAVDALDLEIGDGEFLVLVGPSGCGKSTSLRMLAGLEDVDSGAIYIDETRRHQPAAEGPRHRDGVPELRAVPAHDGVREHGVRAQAAQDLEVRDRPAGQGGRARCCRLEETTSAASRRRSPVVSASVSPWVARSCASRRSSSWTSRCRTSTPSSACRPVRRSPRCSAKLGITTVYVTHDQVEAMTMGHRVAVLLDGVLQQVDAPRALYDHPANVFVAGFIGSPAMNIRTVPLTDNGADFGGLLIPLTREQVAAARADGGDNKVTVGFRPEDTRPGRRQPRAACRSWSSWSRSSARTRTCTATPKLDGGHARNPRRPHRRPQCPAAHGRDRVRAAARRLAARLPRRHRRPNLRQHQN